MTTFQGTINPRPQDGPVNFVGTRVGLTAPLSDWEGEYTTAATWWGDYFSPLVVHRDGIIEIAGEPIDAHYDYKTSTLSFDWTPIANTVAKATVSFHYDENGTPVLSGTINPRRQDGPVAYNGSKTSDVWLRPAHLDVAIDEITDMFPAEANSLDAYRDLIVAHLSNGTTPAPSSPIFSAIHIYKSF